MVSVASGALGREEEGVGRGGVWRVVPAPGTLFSHPLPCLGGRFYCGESASKELK